jgi:protein TonB
MKKYLFTGLLLLLFIRAKAQSSPPPPPQTPPDVDSPTKVDSSKYKLREVDAEFPGGPDKFMEYIKANFKMPKNSGDIRGRVIVSFVIEKNGTIDSVKVMRGLSFDIDKEAKRVISQSPKWEPGMQFGTPVRVLFSVPIAIPLKF